MATVSVGMVINDDATFDIATLLAQADQALYHAKARGRNRVEIASLDLVRVAKQGDHAIAAGEVPTVTAA
jgi:predicted signal transduction protein with EAL and GGDEF domain